MKRLTLTIFSLAIFVGVFAPVAFALDGGGMVGVSTQTAEAQAISPTQPSNGLNPIDPITGLPVLPGTPPTNSGSSAPTQTTTPVTTTDPSQQIGTCVSFTQFNFGSCVAWFVYYIPYSIGNWLLSISARAFDVAASFTLSSKLYTSGSFLQQGWQITRDFSNIFFILILLFIALCLVLDMDIGHANPKKLLVNLILVALIINFSFFITEVVIDISNSLALVFYNQVSVVSTASNGTQVVNDDSQVNAQLQQYAQGTNAAGQSVQYIQTEKPLSVALVAAMKPQILSDASFYNQLCSASVNGFFTSPGNSNTTAACGPSKNGATLTSTNAIMLIAIFILVGIMYFVLAWCFIVALASLFGRMISLFISIVFAPLAFVSIIVPGMKGMPGFGWDEWFSGLMSAAFAAPIFFFFILLISLLSKSSVIPKSLANLSPGIILILVAIQFMILITLMLKATSYVKKASGEIGAAMGGLAGGLAKTLGGFAAGAVLGTATGAVAVASRATIGAGGNRLANSDKYTKWAAGEGNKWQRFKGRAAIGLGNKAANSSFNAAKPLSAVTGLKVDSAGLFSQKNTEGGFQGRATRGAKKDAEFADKLKENQAQAAALKKLKEGKEGDISKQERQIRLAEQELETSKALLQAQKDAKSDAKEAMDQMVKRDPNSKNTKAFRDLQTQYDAAEEAMSKRNFVTDEKGNTKETSLKIDAEDKRLKVAELKKQLANTKEGDRDPDTLEQRKVSVGETKADGTIATQKDVDRKVVKTSDLSLKQIEELIESNKKANAKGYLYSKAVDSGAHVHGDFDKMGNVKGFHVNPNMAGEKNMTKAVTRGLGKASVGAAIGLAVAGPLGAAVGLGFGGLAQVVQEEFAKARTGMPTGYSYAAAERAHHTADSDAKHGADHGGGDHGKDHGGGVISQVTSLFKTAAKSLGGGSGGGGGGGSSHPPAHH